MIGDGLNDILSLQEASVGVSINANCELNLIVSDIIILDSNLWKIPYIFDLIECSNKVISINLFWAFSYNICMVPIAMGCFWEYGV